MLFRSVGDVLGSGDFDEFGFGEFVFPLLPLVDGVGEGVNVGVGVGFSSSIGDGVGVGVSFGVGVGVGVGIVITPIATFTTTA